jgi:nucleoside-diphosphate-sugar epimerase
VNYIVTGCAGFIGSNLVHSLLEQNHKVLGVDRLDDVLYSSEVKKKHLRKLIDHKSFQFIEADVESLEISPQLMKFEPEVVINEAGLPGQSLSWSNLRAYTQSNFLAACAIADLSKKLKVRKFVQASTSSVYGALVSGDEDLPKNPISPYGSTKLAAEQVLKLLFENSEAELTIVRYFSVYGRHQRPDMGIYKFIEAAINGSHFTVFGDGSQSRDFTHIDDAVAATQLAAECGKNLETYNVAGGHVKSVNELLDLIDKCFDRRIPREFIEAPIGDQKYTQGSTVKAQRDLNWAPKVPISAGLLDQINWQISQKNEL